MNDARLFISVFVLFAALHGCTEDAPASSTAANPAPPAAPAAAPAPSGCATPGQTFNCSCGGAERGTQQCLGDGELTQCLCGNANPVNQRRGCDPTEPLRLTCDCEDGRPGLQLCGDDGVLLPCNCDLPEFTDAGAADEDAG